MSSTVPIVPSTCPARVTFTRAQDEPRSAVWNLLNKIITFPTAVRDDIYNIYLIYRNWEMREPLAQNTSPMHWLNSFRAFSNHSITTSIPSVGTALLEQERNLNENPLFREEDLLCLLEIVYPNEEISPDDFLLSCNPAQTHKSRDPIVNLVDAAAIRRRGPELEAIAREIIAMFASEEGLVNASAMALTYTTRVLSKLLLSQETNTQEDKAMGEAIHRLLGAQKPATDEKVEQYYAAAEVIRKVIDKAVSSQTNSPDSLITKLSQKGLTDIQIKGTILSLYIKGAETSSSLLSYLLWQLGRHPESQDALQRGGADSPAMKSLFAEAIRLFTPEYVISRNAATDLVCTVRAGEEMLFHEEIPNGTTIMYMPTVAGRDPSLYEDPNSFKPNRFETNPETLPWLPFGTGPNMCPGQWLAKAEIATFVSALVDQYKISSPHGGEPKVKGTIHLTPAQDISISLQKRTTLV